MEGTVMKQINRRQFVGRTIRGATGLAAGLSVMSGPGAQRVMGANERVRIALIGCGGRGAYVARGLIMAGAELTHLCDVHPGRMDRVAGFLEPVMPRKPEHVSDMRRVFDHAGVDAVIIATPDHWHALATIRAMQAGKDVYVEKPHSQTVAESQLLVQAERRYDRIVQVGTQNRSGAYNKAARDYIRSGRLGKIHLVKVYNLKDGERFIMGEPGTPPDGLNWDGWLGPAPHRPYHQVFFRHGQYNFWDLTGGDMVGDGVHQLDLALMLMGDPGLPRTVTATGGRLAHRGDDSQVPDVLNGACDFGDFILTMEHTNYPRYMHKTTTTIRRSDEFPHWSQNATRIELYGSDQLMVVGRHGGGWQATTYPWQVQEQMYGRPCDDEHYVNFLECVKSRKKPNADLATSHAGACVCHMINIAHRVGNRSLTFDSATHTFNDTEADKLLHQEARAGYEIALDA